MKKQLNRRDFIKKSSSASLGVALGSVALKGHQTSLPQPNLQTEPIGSVCKFG